MKKGILLIIIFLIGCSNRPKTMADFNLEIIHSPMDVNHDGVDDYTDFLLGAKLDAQNKPSYDGAYVAGGYPEDNVGVCTDVISLYYN